MELRKMVDIIILDVKAQANMESPTEADASVAARKRWGLVKRASNNVRAMGSPRLDSTDEESDVQSPKASSPRHLFLRE